MEFLFKFPPRKYTIHKMEMAVYNIRVFLFKIFFLLCRVVRLFFTFHWVICNNTFVIMYFKSLSLLPFMFYYKVIFHFLLKSMFLKLNNVMHNCLTVIFHQRKIGELLLPKSHVFPVSNPINFNAFWWFLMFMGNFFLGKIGIVFRNMSFNKTFMSIQNLSAKH